MKKVLATCAAIFFLLVVSVAPQFAAAAESQVQPQARPSVKPPAQPQGQPQAAPPATQEATVTPLPHMRTAPRKLQKSPSLANVDLRPDVVSSVQTEPSIPNGGTYSLLKYKKKLKMTAVVENVGLTKADKVEVRVAFFRPIPGGQPLPGYKYTVDLGPGEAVSYPFYVFFDSTTVGFSVQADFAGDEKDKGNNGSATTVKFVY